jgi:paraquat-inducible protein A
MRSPVEGSLAAAAQGPDRWLGWLTLLAGGLLIAGWTLPIMTVERLLFLSQEISILQGVGELWGEGEIFLAVIIAAFSIVLPTIKLALALLLWYRGEVGGVTLLRHLGWIELAGRWSMLDVFVVALTVVAIEVSLIDEVTVHPGIYVFTGAIVLSLVVVQRMTSLARRLAATQPE